jgi:hypothetical protein
LTAKVVASSLAALRLALSGYYDEALALTRGVGEIANLLFLFAAKPAELERWRHADEALRKKEFGPVKVRITLETLGLTPPFHLGKLARRHRAEYGAPSLSTGVAAATAGS